jgi:uncharacterized membrane protein YraQ (UPF0718 family)
MKNKKKKNRTWGSPIFLGSVAVLYLILFFISPDRTIISLKTSGNIFIKLIPVLLLVILFMGLLDFFLKPKSISKHLGKESGFKGWAIALAAGILSHGPIYAWYPLLKELQKQGMRIGLMVVFLYNRAIKIPLLPVLIAFFGIKFTLVLLIWTIMASLIEAKVMEMLEGTLFYTST